ncbi:hypothetical protein [Nevskia sp.]|uniref:hypothetical protein n=1 Tax=Nevskia sp. TaxID=1929292 RepID=UPI0026004171|nr:hypothetical protein [Nevskia sp.]
MMIFRLFLVAAWLGLMAYTVMVIQNHGPDLVTVFFGDIAMIAWPGQFNLDFTIMLALSAIWIAWRHQFSAAGLLLALTAQFGGSAFLLLYLLVLSVQARGDVRAMLLGERR